MVSNNNFDCPIIAQCTPQGSGALALLRLSGKQAFAVADKVCVLENNKKISELASHTIHLGGVYDHTQLIDQVLFLFMKAPKTFTGYDTLEITCHNNIFIIQSIISIFIQHGARLAAPGEFSRQALEQGKIDLLKAEAINELIGASNQASIKRSLSQLKGTLSAWIVSLEKEIIHALSYTHASFEFLDEHEGFGQDLLKLIEIIIKKIEIITTSFSAQQQLREGVRVVLIGSVNAGKSSLFNALLNKERSIVTPIAGTTRDSIEAGIFTCYGYITLVDTAGVRTTDDHIEYQGIQRSLSQADTADIVMIAIDCSQSLNSKECATYKDLIERYAHKGFIVYTKADKTAVQENFDAIGSVSTSIHDTASIIYLHDFIKNRVTEITTSNKSPFLINKRHHTLLNSVLQQLRACPEYLEPHNESYELVSIHLQQALELCSELTGKSISEQAMDAVFREFCVGK